MQSVFGVCVCVSVCLCMFQWDRLETKQKLEVQMTY